MFHLFVVLSNAYIVRAVPHMSNMNLLQVILIYVTVNVKLHFLNFVLSFQYGSVQNAVKFTL